MRYRLLITDLDTVKIGKNKFFFDEGPDNSGHFVAIKFNNRMGYFYF